MNKVVKFTTMLVLVFSLASLAFAETGDLALPAFDLAAWGASVLIFGKGLQLLTEFIKVRIKKRFNLPNVAIHLLNFGLGIAVALYLASVGMLTDPTFGALPYPFGGIAFGVVAAIIAAGWYDTETKPDKRPPDPRVRNGQL